MKSIMSVMAMCIAMVGAYKPVDAAEPTAPYRRSVPASLTEADFKKPISPEKLQGRKNVPAPLTPADFHRSTPPAPTTLTGYRRNVPASLTAADFHKKASTAEQGPAK